MLCNPSLCLSFPEAKDAFIDDSCTSNHHTGDISLLDSLQDNTQLSDIATLKSEVQISILSLSGHLENIDDIGILKDIRVCISSAIKAQ